MSQFDDAFAGLRPALSPRLREASPVQIRTELAAEGIDADAAEDFLGSLSHAASAIGSAVAPRLPGILQGAMQGASTGMAAGPYGALIGALGGAVAGGLSSPSSASHPASSPAPSAGGGLGAAAGSPSAISALLGAAGGSAGAGGGAIGSLLGLLTQPQVTQGLMSMLMGNAGSRTVPVAGQQVPAGAIANMIGHFANQAAAEWEDAYGVPEAETFPGLSESADGAERAATLAQAIAIEGLFRSASGPIRAGEGDASIQPGVGAEADYGESEYGSEASDEADWGEADYGEADSGELASYDPVYLG
jgi:hypothetical protein